MHLSMGYSLSCLTCARVLGGSWKWHEGALSHIAGSLLTLFWFVLVFTCHAWVSHATRLEMSSSSSLKTSLVLINFLVLAEMEGIEGSCESEVGRCLPLMRVTHFFKPLFHQNILILLLHRLQLWAKHVRGHLGVVFREVVLVQTRVRVRCGLAVGALCLSSGCRSVCLHWLLVL